MSDEARRLRTWDPNSDIPGLLRQKNHLIVTSWRWGTKPKVHRVPFNYGEVSQ